MEVNTQRRKAGLDEKIPDIHKTLDTVRFLRTRKVRLAPPAIVDHGSTLTPAHSA